MRFKVNCFCKRQAMKLIYPTFQTPQLSLLCREQMFKDPVLQAGDVPFRVHNNSTAVQGHKRLLHCIYGTGQDEVQRNKQLV